VKRGKESEHPSLCSNGRKKRQEAVEYFGWGIYGLRALGKIAQQQPGFGGEKASGGRKILVKVVQRYINLGHTRLPGVKWKTARRTERFGWLKGGE